MYRRASGDSGEALGSPYRDSPNPNDSQQNFRDQQGYGDAGGHQYGAGYRNPQPTTRGVSGPGKARRNPWLWYGLPLLLILIIVGAVVGGIEGSDASKKSGSKSSSGGGGGGVTGNDAGPGAGQGSGDSDNFVATGYNSGGYPVYPSSTVAAALAAPTSAGSSSNLSCPYVTLPSGFTAGGSGASVAVRTDHPRLFADQARWDCVLGKVPHDAYLSYWNETVMNNATKFAQLSPTNYSIDGCLSCSGVLDVAREVQLRIKHWAYAWRVTKDPSWGERAWTELQVAAGNTSQYFGPAGDNWNSQHFLDVGEFTVAFAIAYDWMNDYWTDDQKTAIMWSILTLGIAKGLTAYQGSGWWALTEVNGNWNCVCNGGLTIGALAIIDVDPTGTAAQMLGKTISNAQSLCAMGTEADGTWSETANYWYFGNQAAAQMSSALETATGSNQGFWDNNPSANLAGMFHMYISGQCGMFDYGDCGPNKYTATANPLLYYGRYFNQPQYTLYQRDQQDATDALSLLWYDPTVSGAWIDNLPLDHNFADPHNAWVSMRGSWTDYNSMYVGMKAGNMTGHQTHGDIDAGTFVLDALGQRWAGELCQANYLGKDYFTSETQDATRWLYYRTRTEGQNTLLLNWQNQNVDVTNPTTFGSTNETETLGQSVPSTSTAFWWTDLTAAYNGTSIKRGVRFLNGRKQALIQDEMTITEPIQWRMHTNASIAMSNNNMTATLSLNGQKLEMIIQGTVGAFTTAEPVRSATEDPPLPDGGTGDNADLPNPGVTVLVVPLDAGTYTLPILFNPQWSGMSSSDFVNPPQVPLAQWSLTSHG